MNIAPQHILQAQQCCLQTEHVQLAHDITSVLNWLWKVYQFDVRQKNRPNMKLSGLPLPNGLVGGSAEKGFHEVEDALLEVI